MGTLTSLIQCLIRVTYHNAWQELMICGLDTPIFNQALVNFQHICALFDQEFGENVLYSDHILKAQGRGEACTIEVSNRFFTALKDAGSNPIAILFKKGVDPNGYLAALLSEGDLIHTEENTVTYYK